MQAALHWFCTRTHLRGEGVSRDLVDRIPGKRTDRKTAMGELNWIFTAITDTIAWNVLPRALFQRLFRQACLEGLMIMTRITLSEIVQLASCLVHCALRLCQACMTCFSSLPL